MSFNLATSVSELRGTEYVNRRVIQIPATREINNGNFFRSDQTFRFSVAGNTWWSPSQSYFKIRCSLTDVKGQPLTANNRLAPSFCFMDCMYRSASFSMNNIRVSQIQDYMPQISALKNRHGKSKDYRQGVGNSLAFYDTDFFRRQSRVISDGLLQEVKEGHFTPANLHIVTASTRISITQTAVNKPAHITVISQAASPDGNVGFVPGDIIYTNRFGAGNDPDNKLQVLKIIGRIFDSGYAYALAGGGGAVNHIAGNAEYIVESLNGSDVLDAGAFDPTAGGVIFNVRRSLRKQAEGAGNFECVWTPPLGISDCAHYLPAGQYEYVLSPQQQETAYKLAIESNDGGDKVAGVNFVLTMDSIELYVVTVEQARVDSLDYLLDLKEITCVPFTLTNNTWTSNMLVVPPSTSRLTVAYQDTRVTTGTQYPITKFVSGANLQDLIERFNITYANVVYPSNDLDLKVVATFTNATTRISRFTTAYNDMLLANGSAFSDTTSETLVEWLDNGYYLSYPTFKEAKDTSTQVVVKQSFSAPVANTQLLLFASYSTITSVSIKSGQVVSVSTVEA
jgi:hypothetical protein